MAFTGATSGLAAGAQTNDTVLDYAQEVNYGVPPSGNYQLMRITGETLTSSQTTARPDEINPVKEVAQSVVTQVQASGSISGALSSQTFDDMLSAVMGNDTGNILKKYLPANETFVLVSKDAGNSGQDSVWCGNSTSGAVNGFFSEYNAGNAVAITDANSGKVYSSVITQISADGATALFSPGSLGLDKSVTLSGNSTVSVAGIVNGNIDKTYTFRKKLLSGWLMYSGSLVTQVQIQLQQGQFGTVSVDVTSKSETRSTSDVSSGSLPAPTGIVHNTVKNFLGVTIFGKVPAGCVTNCSITLARDGSGNDYGNGHADACGARSGSFTASGSIEFYFRTWDEYDAMLAGTQGPIVIKSVDDDGNGYAFTFLNAALRNGKVNTSQKNQTVKATFDIEGNPLPGGTTFAISRITPAA
ncbi:hypothetical protein ACI01nite_25010 [Acetobacter cibinongensis]|uniref:Phage minor tail protein n=1 Tax=Acetobacter cibinongensis TaxID=146475 RepID=A0A0D6N7Y2_9PROT|nr:phage tail tube protein [Acetobacter cibinongensis]GAN61606.1 phage minor tail protein [Acetobacter cibinongensis]GBQ17610.1 phage minor tail protein [Acetobacter cibinongensis NRIC 0482]GEL59899.1 hypothetical protein ACI01nite_25010 [Acetobacter cibinongensis]